MLARVFTCAVIGLDGVVVEVEVDTGGGLPAIVIVSLPDTAVQESREHVQAAINNTGLFFPRRRLIVNLAPAAVRKEGPSYDLPIAMGILIASGQIHPSCAQSARFLGALSLDGGVRHVRGVLPMAAMARAKKFDHIYTPADDAAEASLIPDIDVYPVHNLNELIDHLSGGVPIQPQPHSETEESYKAVRVDFKEVKGQEHVKRALEIAAAGNHNVLLSDPPGAGKTMMARALVSILPPMTIDEALHVTRVYSVADQLSKEEPLLQTRPFRAPHHTVSHAGLVGGGKWPNPGEISLAHRGVLFLDELPEFPRRVLEALRQPLEDKIVTISRAQGSLTFPVNFMLVAARNPCPCGYQGDTLRECTCTSAAISRYEKRLSGPLLDRIDLHVEVPAVEYEKLSDDRFGEPSKLIRKRVITAKTRQIDRYLGQLITSNAEMTPAQIRELCPINQEGNLIMRTAMEQLQLSARAYHRVLRLGRTIADLAESEMIEVDHLAEALQYRPPRPELFNLN